MTDGEALALEITANVSYAVSVFLAQRNSVHTWWTGILGSVLFAIIFFAVQLYADVTLMLFFVVTSITGWWRWEKGGAGVELPVRYSSPRLIAALFTAGLLVTVGYGSLLSHFTDAAAPFPDSVVLAFSVLAQFLLVGRRVESWWGWLIVNTVAVPLYISRGLNITAALYVAFWINAVVALPRWHRLATAGIGAQEARA